MKNRDEIFDQLRKTLIDLFEVDEVEIKPSALLYDDLDLDSIDAVDLIIQLKEITGKKIKTEDFKSVRTVEDLIDVVARLIGI